MNEPTTLAREAHPRSKGFLIRISGSRHWPLVVCLALSACGKPGDLDGFKDVKFGLSAQEVESLGFTCGSDGECEPNSAPATVEPIAALLASADVAKGEQVFKKCAACHNVEQGGENGLGSNLYGIVGEAIASDRRGFAFSDALKAKGGTWDFAALNAWIADPKRFAPGSKMTFAGISDASDRANLIAYLNAQGSNLSLRTATTELEQSTVSEAPQRVPDYTLFGKTAGVRPKLKGGKVSSIDVALALTTGEAIDLLKGEYGEPKSFDYENLFGGRYRKTYWLFDDGASISVTEAVSEGWGGATGIDPTLRRAGIDPDAYIRNHTSVSYLDKTATADLLDRAKGNTIDPDDT